MQAKNYIVELPSMDGDTTTIYLEADGESVDKLFAILSVDARGASIVDNGYRSLKEAMEAWTNAIPPKPEHLTGQSIAENYTIQGRTARARLQ
jgi:hypothetical protein